jgi:hypothetical protein
MEMLGKKITLVSVGIFILLLALTGIALGDLPPAIDMNVTKIARNDSHSSIQEVPAGSKFYYNISVINPDPVHNATEVAVTDKLPYDVVYDSAKAQASNGAILINATIHKTGDLLYVYFEKIPKGKTFYINITVYAPAEAPTTLYNIVNLRYANDPEPDNNTFTLATYVPFPGYDKPAAVESFEELLHNQTRLLFDFEDLLHVTPRNYQENYTFLASFEQLLRAQANLSLSFEDLLENETNSGWDLGNFTEAERIMFLKSFKRIIWDEAFLFASYEMKLKDAWVGLDCHYAPGHSQDMQTEFIASFEGLLKEQVKLFDSYQLLLKTIGDIDPDEKVDAFAAFESLLRVEANLLMSFEDLLKMKYKGGGAPELECGEVLAIDMDYEATGIEGTAGNYTINITNLGADPVELNTLTANYNFIDSASIQQTVCLLHPTTGPDPSAGWTVAPGGLCSGTAEYDTGLIGPIDPGDTATVTLALHVDTTPANPTGHSYNTVCATWDGCSVCNLTETEKTSPYPIPPQAAGEVDNNTMKTAMKQTA